MFYVIESLQCPLEAETVTALILSFHSLPKGYSAELSQVVESEFNHYLLRLNIGSQPQRNVRDVVVARKIKFIINMRTIFFYLVK